MIPIRRVFKTRYFQRWMRKTGMFDAALCKAVLEMEAGLIEADLGGGLFKKRVALPGRGKRAGARTLLATNRRNRWFFVFGFEKNVCSNISDTELEALQMLATDLLSQTDSQLDLAITEGSMQEICNDNDSQKSDPRCGT